MFGEFLSSLNALRRMASLSGYPQAHIGMMVNSVSALIKYAIQ